jgi:hypothetical protein
MTFHRKAKIGRVIGILGMVGAIYGLDRMYSAVLVHQGVRLAETILYSSVVVGIAGFIVARYNDAHAERNDTTDSVAIETLAKLGKKMRKQSLIAKDPDSTKVSPGSNN